MEPALQIFELADGMSFELSHESSRFLVRSWCNSNLTLRPGATHFGFVASGQADLLTGESTYRLSPGFYFSAPDVGQMQGAASRGMVISQLDYRGLFQLGGPVESTGRLQYIDGCSDTLLVPPVVKGDACLNLLCIPPGTDQTAHTHPSFRVGVVVSGRGVCRGSDGQSFSMTPATVFILGADCAHSFHTSLESMRVVAFHPDSNFGPSRDDHPMINRTLINGVAAGGMSKRVAIRDGTLKGSVRS